MAEIRLEFRVLIYPEDKWWIAHCLEMDLPAEGKNPKEALKNLMDLVNFQITSAIAEADLDSVFCSAPPELWRLFAYSTDASQTTTKLPKPVKRLDVREATFA